MEKRQKERSSSSPPSSRTGSGPAVRMGMAASYQVQLRAHDRRQNQQERNDEPKGQGQCTNLFVYFSAHAATMSQMSLLLGMLNAVPWKYFPLTLQFLSSTYAQMSVGAFFSAPILPTHHEDCLALFSGLQQPPSHMSVLIAPLSDLPVFVEEEQEENAEDAAFSSGSDSKDNESEDGSDADIAPAAAALESLDGDLPRRCSGCSICQTHIARDAMPCSCGRRFHIECLAERWIAEDSSGSGCSKAFSSRRDDGPHAVRRGSMPEGGACPGCGVRNSWLDMLQAIKPVGWGSRPRRRQKGSRKRAGGVDPVDEDDRTIAVQNKSSSAALRSAKLKDVIEAQVLPGPAVERAVVEGARERTSRRQPAGDPERKQNDDHPMAARSSGSDCCDLPSFLTIVDSRPRQPAARQSQAQYIDLISDSDVDAPVPVIVTRATCSRSEAAEAVALGQHGGSGPSPSSPSPLPLAERLRRRAVASGQRSTQEPAAPGRVLSDAPHGSRRLSNDGCSTEDVRDASLPTLKGHCLLVGESPTLATRQQLERLLVSSSSEGSPRESVSRKAPLQADRLPRMDNEADMPNGSHPEWIGPPGAMSTADAIVSKKRSRDAVVGREWGNLPTSGWRGSGFLPQMQQQQSPTAAGQRRSVLHDATAAVCVRPEVIEIPDSASTPLPTRRCCVGDRATAAGGMRKPCFVIELASSSDETE